MHGGLRYQSIEADITLSGGAYGGLSGYNAAFSKTSATGYLLGAAYERPDIALRVALTYFSEVEHDVTTRETVNGIPVNLINPLLSPTSTTKISSPEAINLDFQTGVAANTLVFGSIRYAKWSQLIVSPTFFDAAVDPATANSSLSDLDDTWSYNIGVGRRFNEKLSGSIAIGYEAASSDDLVSPLAPTNGQTSLSIGLSYDVNDAVNISGGVRYTRLGDARPETGTPDTARANFTDNNAVSVGFRVGFNF